MKTTIRNLFILLFISNISIAQDFAPVGAKWHFSESFAWSEAVGFITYESIGDTVINNVSCRIIYKNKNSCCIPGGLHFLHQSNDTIFVFNQTTGTFDMIIDFGADVGESWILNTNPDGNLMSDSATCIVDSISYFHYSPLDSLKILHVRVKSHTYDIIFGDTIYYSIPYQIIEKIGYNPALLLSDCIYFCDVNFEGDVRCYEDPGVGLIIFSSVDCEYTPVENLIVKDEFVIYPNPATNSISLIIPESDLNRIIEYEIVDHLGQILHQSRILNNHVINIAYLTQGVYSLVLKGNGINIGTRKFVKQ